MTQQHPDLAAEQAYIDHAYQCLESQPRRGLADAQPPRGHPRRHVPGPLRARRVRRGRGQPADPARPRQRRAGVRPHRPHGRDPRRPRDASTSAAWRSPTRRASRSSSTGGPRSPSRSTGPPGASRWASPAAATSPCRAASCSASRTSCSATATSASATTTGLDGDNGRSARPGLRGYSTLLAALERGRTGQLGDIVATIQAEQDEIIR